MSKPTPKTRVAVLGWGSLLSRPGALRVSGRWQTDGPRLPIEFARISSRERLTLVIVPRRRLIRTYWALSACRSVASAIQNLAVREKTSTANIGFLDRDNQHRASFAQYLPRLGRWLCLHELDAVIWTDLTSNFETKTGKAFSHAAALEHLRHLTGQERQAAMEYIRTAPRQTDTPLRRRIRRELGW